MNGYITALNQIDYLNLLAIERLEQLNINAPTQAQIDVMEAYIKRMFTTTVKEQSAFCGY